MPQMSPINWLILFLIFSITFIMFNILNYFSFFSNKFNKMPMNFLKKSNYLNWKW